MSPKAKKHARSDSTNGTNDVVKRAKEEEKQRDLYHDDNALSHPSVQRGKEIDSDTPFSQLEELQRKNKSDHKPKNVLHWFRSKDLRVEDNKGLHAASQKAKEGSGTLLTMYLFSPKDMERHGTSAARTDFILETLRILKQQLQEKHIPLAIVTAEERSEKTEKVMTFVKENDISHMYANYEYEVDELRRDIDVAKHVQQEKDLSFQLLHDQTVLVPGTVVGQPGKPMKVFTPYHKAWLAETKASSEVLDLVPPPEANDKSAAQHFKQLFDSRIPDLPNTKQFRDDDERDRIRSLWPAGHDAALERLKDFLKRKVRNYAADRSCAAKEPSSRMSAYFSAGMISVREALAVTKDFNDGDHFDDGDVGVASWVREIVFREFYRQVLVITPHTSMNLPQNMKFDYVNWEDDEEGWLKWCSGTTGVPFVDAGMRQLNTEAYMHNRLRMNTSSYLSGNLLIDYRRGERYFAEHLIDWDLSNNTQGWEPSYTMFNPVVQAEKHDPDGDFIRRWVPELKSVKGKAIYAPHDRLSKEEFAKLGYPRPHVDFRETSQRAKERYKHDLHIHDDD